MIVATVRNQSSSIRFRGRFIDERKRKTKRSGKSPWTASPEPVRSARTAPSAPKPSAIDGARTIRTTHAERTATRSARRARARRRGRRRLDERRARSRPPSWPASSARAAHRRQREPVEEAGLDVAREVGAGVHRREQRALDERNGERRSRGTSRSGSRGGASPHCSPPALTASSSSGKRAAGRRSPAGAACARPSGGRAARPGRERSRRRGSRVCSSSGALERAAGLGEEDVVERRRVELEVGRRRAPRRRARARPRRGRRSPCRAARRRAPRRRRHRLAEALEDAPRRSPARRGRRDRLDGRPADLGLQRRRRALGDDPAVVDDPDAVGEHVGLLEVLRRQEDGDAVLAGRAGRPRPRARCGSAGRGRSSARRGRGSAAGGRARARGRAGASCRPSSVRTLRSAASVRPTRSSSSSLRGSPLGACAGRAARSAGAGARGR